MTPDICSILAYQEIMESGLVGKRQAIVLRVFSERPNTPLTATEMVQLVERGEEYTTSSLESPTLCNRLAELVKMGWLRKYDKVVCKLSKKTVNRWIYTGQREKLPSKIEDVCCDKCKGKGTIRKRVYKKEEATYEG